MCASRVVFRVTAWLEMAIHVAGCAQRNALIQTHLRSGQKGNEGAVKSRGASFSATARFHCQNAGTNDAEMLLQRHGRRVGPVRIRLAGYIAKNIDHLFRCRCPAL